MNELSNEAWAGFRAAALASARTKLQLSGVVGYDYAPFYAEERRRAREELRPDSAAGKFREGD